MQPGVETIQAIVFASLLMRFPDDCEEFIYRGATSSIFPVQWFGNGQAGG